MTPAQFLATLSAIGWNPYTLAPRIGVSDRTTRRWSSGENPIPPRIAEWLRRVERWLAENPAPGRS